MSEAWGRVLLERRREGGRGSKGEPPMLKCSIPAKYYKNVPH